MYTCDFPNCENAMHYGLAGGSRNPEHQQPSQWCKVHYKYVMEKKEHDPDWITKFQHGKIKGLPKDKRKFKGYAW